MAKKPKLEEGDLVYHRSNPNIKMVVDCVEDEYEDEFSQVIECTWIDTIGAHHVETFSEMELEKSITL